MNNIIIQHHDAELVVFSMMHIRYDAKLIDTMLWQVKVKRPRKDKILVWG